MIDFKTWNLKHFGDIFMLGFVYVLIITLVHMVVSPLLVTILPAVFTTGLTLTDTLLLLVLLRLTIR